MLAADHPQVLLEDQRHPRDHRHHTRGRKHEREQVHLAEGGVDEHGQPDRAEGGRENEALQACTRTRVTCHGCQTASATTAQEHTHPASTRPPV